MTRAELRNRDPDDTIDFTSDDGKTIRSKVIVPHPRLRIVWPNGDERTFSEDEVDGRDLMRAATMRKPVGGGR